MSLMAHVRQVRRTGAAVLEVHLLEAVRDDLSHLLVAGTGVARLEQAAGVLRREVHGGGRKRPSSVVPIGAVRPNRARVSTVMPPVAAACLRRRSRTWGCRRDRTAVSILWGGPGRVVAGRSAETHQA